MKPGAELAIFRLGGLIVSATALVLSLPALIVMLLLVTLAHFTPHDAWDYLWMPVTGGATLWALLAGMVFQIRPRRWSYMLVFSSLVLVPCVWVYWALAFLPRLLH